MLYSRNQVRTDNFSIHLLIATGIGLALYTFAPVRILITENTSSFHVKTLISYFGQAMVFSAIIFYLYIRNIIALDKFAFWMLSLVIMTSMFELVSNPPDFGNIKQNIIYNKTNQGLVVATFTYLIWKNLYDRSPDLARSVLVWLFWTFVAINTVICITVLSFSYDQINHQFLNNNRTALELMALALTIYLIESRKDQRIRHTFLAFSLVIFFATIYSARSILLGSAFICIWIAFGARGLDLRARVPFLLLSCVSLLILLHFIGYNFGSGKIGQLQSSIIRWATSTAIYPADPLSKDNTRPIQLRNPQSQMIASVLGYRINNDNIAELPLNTISTISRVRNIIGATRNFIENPFGKGHAKSRERTALSHHNHALVLIFLEAYGIFFIAYFLCFVIRGLPAVSMVAWVPFGITALFFANFTWVVFLPLIPMGVKSDQKSNQFFSLLYSWLSRKWLLIQGRLNRRTGIHGPGAWKENP